MCLCVLFLQELRSWEEELTQAAMQQKCQEEALRRREQELAEREIHILERELNIIIHQLYREKPHVESRQGKFRRNRLKLKDGNRISLPSGTDALCLNRLSIESSCIVTSPEIWFIIIITFYFNIQCNIFHSLFQIPMSLYVKLKKNQKKSQSCFWAGVI